MFKRGSRGGGCRKECRTFTVCESLLLFQKSAGNAYSFLKQPLLKRQQTKASGAEWMCEWLHWMAWPCDCTLVQHCPLVICLCWKQISSIALLSFGWQTTIRIVDVSWEGWEYQCKEILNVSQRTDIIIYLTDCPWFISISSVHCSWLKKNVKTWSCYLQPAGSWHTSLTRVDIGFKFLKRRHPSVYSAGQTI